MKAEFEAHGVQRVEVWNKGIDTHVFHPKHGAKAMWGETHAPDEDDDPAALAAAAREMRERLTGGEPEASAPGLRRPAHTSTWLRVNQSIHQAPRLLAS